MANDKNSKYEQTKKSDQPTVDRWNSQSEKTVNDKYSSASADQKAAFDREFKNSR